MKRRSSHIEAVNILSNWILHSNVLTWKTTVSCNTPKNFKSLSTHSWIGQPPLIIYSATVDNLPSIRRPELALDILFWFNNFDKQEKIYFFTSYWKNKSHWSILLWLKQFCIQDIHLRKIWTTRFFKILNR